jgi:hypothetical protein
MNDCLVTKLKASVNNKALERLGYITLEQSSSSSSKNSFMFTEDATIWCVNCVYNGNENVNVPLNQSQDFSLDYANVTLDTGESLPFKYQIPLGIITRLTLGTKNTIDCDKFDYIPNLTSFNDYAGCAYIGDTSKLINLGINLRLSNITEGNDIDITNMGLDGKSWSFTLNGSKKLTGSLNNLGKKVPSGSSSLTFSLPTTKDVSIDIDTFVRNAVAAGVTTKTMTGMDLVRITVRCNGTELANMGYNKSIHWEPASETGKTTITVGTNTDDYVVTIDNAV